jgi:competence protein ComEC
VSLEIFKRPIFWLILAIILAWVAILKLPDQQLHLVFCDVGQGDAILIYQGNNQILIDGGPDQSVLTCLANHLPFWDREIEMVVATHPDADHITGLIDVIERYDVDHFVINSIGKNSAVFREFKSVVVNEGREVYFPEEGDEIKIGSLKLVVLWPQRQEKVLGASITEKEVNETSIVLRLSYGNFDALFPGDISTKIEEQLDLPTSQKIELLKVAHHGSKYSTSAEFLEKISPELAIISVGKNPWGHPTEEVLERLSSLDTRILRTDQEGEIEVVVNKGKWGVVR